jgi:hypothetical protein
MKKIIYTLNLNPADYRQITDLTYPFIKAWAEKIGAEFIEIKDRKFPQWKSPTYEKLQIFELGKDNDWNIFIDADALVHPDMPDITRLKEMQDMKTCAHNGCDAAFLRWRTNRHFERDGRNIGSCTWFCVAPKLCLELYAPMTDMTPEETYRQIFPLVGEQKAGYEPWRLVEDYVMSYNIAKYGLRFKTFKDMAIDNNLKDSDLLRHFYAMPVEEKIIRLTDAAKQWSLI